MFLKTNARSHGVAPVALADNVLQPRALLIFLAFERELMILRTLVAASTLFVLPVLAHAASFTYNVNDQFSNFSVTGTITTDKNSGSLATGDITGYNLTLDDGNKTLLLNPADSQRLILGDSLTATTTGLFFNFSNIAGDLFAIQDPHIGVGTNYLCYQGVAGFCDDFEGAHESVRIDGDGQKLHNLSGNLEIAAMASTVIPEPGSFVLLGSGMLGVAGVLRRKLVG